MFVVLRRISRAGLGCRSMIQVINKAELGEDGGETPSDLNFETGTKVYILLLGSYGYTHSNASKLESTIMSFNY